MNVIRPVVVVVIIIIIISSSSSGAVCMVSLAGLCDVVSWTNERGRAVR